MAEDRERERILVVDDDPVNRQLVASHLRSGGYEPLLAADGREALDMAQSHHPRIIISDWMMPKMDGLDLCRSVRAMSEDRFVYLIMVSVYAAKDKLMEAFEAGVDDFISKPLHEGELLARLRAGLRLIEMYEQANVSAQTMSRLNGELYEKNERLRQLASTDELTGLLNRRQAGLRLNEQWAIASRYEQPLACAMIDIDHFKRINDEYGHETGDEVLKEIAGVLLDSVRTADSVCRVGGEEFLVLFPRQGTAQATRAAERCRAAVESRIFDCQGRPEQLTVSVGVAERTEHMDASAQLLRAADLSLYDAKKRGRNAVVADEPDD